MTLPGFVNHDYVKPRSFIDIYYNKSSQGVNSTDVSKPRIVMGVITGSACNARVLSLYGHCEEAGFSRYGGLNCMDAATATAEAEGYC